jgi:hypothetical protein
VSALRVASVNILLSAGNSPVSKTLDGYGTAAALNSIITSTP